MAKINEQKITITLSKLIRDNTEEYSIMHEEMLATLIAVIQEMVGNDTLIEIE
jgi:hypothetical protein